ncbi:HTH domain-containing protein [Rhodobacterales bacterium HKCCE2091]|nr:HTH domain-containing protein [Rhodobacterales bacterium HKCCE2091]
MSRPDRLFRLLHALRTLPRPVTAERLAEVLEVSPRTIYRDIATLRAAGARIEGEAGVGFDMVEDPALPPLTFDRMEIEALVLGLSEARWKGDPALSEAAAGALAKIAAALPERRQGEVLHAIGQVYRFRRPQPASPFMATIRQACWSETALDIDYRDGGGSLTARRILPLSVVYLDEGVVVLAWCCLRREFRRFRPERIVSARATGESFRPRRVALLRDYVAFLRGAGPDPAYSNSSS